MVLDANELAAPHMQRGTASYGQQDLHEAADSFRAALAAQPDLTSAKFNLGVVCRDLEQNDSALNWFMEVIASGEILADAYNNLGILAARSEQFDRAVEHFQEAIRQRDAFPLAHFNLGTLLLRMGQWREGLREYEWRWQTPSFTPIECPQPQWNGQQLDGTLLLHTEQGIGDVFQFARFIPMIRERCRRVIFLRPETMACMFADERWADEVRSPGEIGLDEFHAVLPLMSAPWAMDIAMDRLPLRENYLTPQAREVPLGPPHVANPQLKVGITWGGSPTHVNDAFRSSTIDVFCPLLAMDHIAFYSLQVGDRSKELDTLGNDIRSIRDLRGEQKDFADTAAIVQQLDLVITVDTSVLHLCGGMGIPAWALLSRRSDWRWLEPDRTDTPWYPSVRLYRQRELNNWDELMQRVAKDLLRLRDSKR